MIHILCPKIQTRFLFISNWTKLIFFMLSTVENWNTTHAVFYFHFQKKINTKHIGLKKCGKFPRTGIGWFIFFPINYIMWKEMEISSESPSTWSIVFASTSVIAWTEGEKISHSPPFPSGRTCYFFYSLKKPTLVSMLKRKCEDESSILPLFTAY